ncbi:MAG: folate-binding protein [Proteobacteria bacterium]|nr:folate-binding protein [Pseudomonadota bacterium]
MEYLTLDRAVIEISGDDKSPFLQGIISNDITKVTDGSSIYTCLLSPQGKYLFDFFVTGKEGKFLLDVPKRHAAELIKRLTMYKLRSKVEIKDVSNIYSVFACYGSGAEKVGIPDPRDARLGSRVIASDAPIGKAGSMEAYDALRISLTIPDSEKDLEQDKSYPLHYRMEALHAIDFDKGCYVGQEVTARMKHRNAVKQMLYRVKANAPLPAPGTVITADGISAGELRSISGNEGLALLEVAALEKKQPLKAEALEIIPC